MEKNYSLKNGLFYNLNTINVVPTPKNILQSSIANEMQGDGSSKSKFPKNSTWSS